MKVMKKISALIFVLLLTFSFAGSAFAVDVRVDTDSYLQNLPSPARVRNGEFFVSRQVEEYADGSVAVIDVYSSPAVITRASTSRWYTAYYDWVSSNSHANLWAKGYFTYDSAADTISVSNASGGASTTDTGTIISNQSTAVSYGRYWVVGRNFAKVQFSCTVTVSLGFSRTLAAECVVKSNGEQI